MGAAPGVGKTYAMLEEAHALAGDGVDVVVGLVLDHGRRATAALVQGLEIIPPAMLSYRGTQLTELDVDAILARHPEVVLVDEYAHTSVSDPQHKRWQDIQRILEAGINVISTLNIQHLASLGDVVARITGVNQQERVPDDVVRKADQIELVDISPELLRQRLSAGNVYAADKVDEALANYFRTGNLAALRELALLWLADQVDEALASYRANHKINSSWPARERAVVGLTGGPECEVLIRRAARILARSSGGELIAVHVRAADGIRVSSEAALANQKQLVKDLGGTFHSITGEDPAQALLEFATSVNATQLVLGISRRRWVSRILSGPGVGAKVVANAGDLDVHMVPHPLGGRGVRMTRTAALGRRRLFAGFASALGLPALIEWLLALWGPESFVTDTLLQLMACVAVALIGGVWPALLAVVFALFLLNYFSAAPTGSLSIADPEILIALVIFLGVTLVVAVVVGVSARRSKSASMARNEAEILNEMASSALAERYTSADFLERTREFFRVESVSLLSESDGKWRVNACAGVPLSTPDSADAVAELPDGSMLAVKGRTLAASETRLLNSFAALLSALLERLELSSSRKANLRLAEGNVMRTAILRAVSHDLRTPLAAIKLSASSLLQKDVQLAEAEREELIEGIEISTDRLSDLVSNLLDMSRISAETTNALVRPVRWSEATERALSGLGDVSRVRVQLQANMPPINADPTMLERIIANIVQNALKYAPTSDVMIVGSAIADPIQGVPASELRIVDHGKGVSGAEVLSMFQPFQRLDDVPDANGVGLGLAVAKGFTEALGGEIAAEKTPGGGLTMVIRLPLSTGVGQGRA